MLFQNRRQAGELLARRIVERGIGGRGALVLALPRGGVPVAAPVARALAAELDVFLVRKLGLPGNEEYAMGALASGGLRTLNEEVVRELGIHPATVAAIERRERAELERRERVYRGGRPFPSVAGRTVVLVDDGLATGATMRAAVLALRLLRPGRIVVAVPVGSRAAVAALSAVADQVECLVTPEPFHGVGMWYANFGQTSDEEVLALLATAPIPDAA